MSKIKIVTDSTAYLNPEDIQRYNIEVIPLSVTINNENYKENSKPYEVFFANLKKSDIFPTTSQPSIGDFYSAYSKILKEYDEIISIHISSFISGTFFSANTAASEINKNKIQVFDSTTTVGALEDMVLNAAQMAKDGASASDIIEKLTFIKNNIKLLFIVEDLKYLQKGGRIGKANAILGTILNIKPILYISGEIGLFDKVRTRKKAMLKIIEELEKMVDAHGAISNINVRIIHIDNLNGANELGSLLKEKWPDIQYNLSSCGPVIGSHIGSGGLGLTFWPKQSNFN